MAKQRSKKSLLKPSVFLGVILVTAGLALLALELTNTTHFFHAKPQSKQVVTAGKPVAAPSQAGSSPAQSPSGQKTITTDNSQPSGGATDTHGSSVPDTTSSQWVTSQTGYITVKSPLADSRLQDGGTVAGSAKVGTVYYRLTDNKVGVIAQGQLTVTDGKFSGSLHFQPKGTGGRLDVYSTDSAGIEYNEVQINVSF
jgi:hypothetical protein